MTTMTTAQSRRTETAQRVRFVDLLRSEWIKTASLPSTWITLIGMAVLGASAGVFAVSNTMVVSAEYGTDVPRLMYDLTMIAGSMCPVFAGILGVMSVGGEYTSGTMQRTLLAVPSRLPVLAAKAIVLFCLVAVTAALMIFGAWAAAYPLAAEGGIDLSLSTPGVLSALVGVVAYLALVAVFGIGITAVVRSTTAGAIIVFVVTFLGPALSMLLPPGLLSSIARGLVIGNGGYYMVQVPVPDAPFANDQGFLSMPAAYLLVIAWTIIAMVAGAISLKRRDA